MTGIDNGGHGTYKDWIDMTAYFLTIYLTAPIRWAVRGWRRISHP